MGKSLGNVLEPRSLLRAYGADAVRFYFLKEIVFGQVLTSACAAFQHCPVPRLSGQRHVCRTFCTRHICFEQHEGMRLPHSSSWTQQSFWMATDDTVKTWEELEGTQHIIADLGTRNASVRELQQGA